MIDRTRPNPPLTGTWIKNAFYISGGLFSALLVVTAVLWLFGVIAISACWLWILLGYVLLYLIALIPAIVALGILGAISQSNEDNDGKGTGCFGLILTIGLIWFYNTSGWFTGVTSYATKNRETVGSYGITAYTQMTEYALSVWAVFKGYEIYTYAWFVFVLGLLITSFYLLILTLARMDAPLRRVARGVRYQCPRCSHNGVKRRCPSCRNEHDDVYPSRDGIWMAKCGHCTEEFGTTGWTGLLEVPKTCAGCGHDMNHPDLGALPEYHVAVLGNRGAGKSTLIAAALTYLERSFGARHEMQVIYENAHAELVVRNGMTNLDSGREQQSTPSQIRPAAAMIAVRPRRIAGGFLLYLYDTSGADQEAGDTNTLPGISSHDFHDFLDGAILCVDPTVEEGLSARIGTPTRGHFGAVHVLSRMLQFWQRRRGVSAGGKMPFPLAIVMTKADLGDLGVRIGDFIDFADAGSSNWRFNAEAQSQPTRALLAEAREGDLLSLAESHFREVSYFTATAQGRPFAHNQREAFQSKNAFAPFGWLLLRCGALTTSPSAFQWIGRTVRYITRCLAGLEGRRTRIWSRTIVTMSVAVAFAAAYWFLGPIWAGVGLALPILSLVVRSVRRHD